MKRALVLILIFPFFSFLPLSARSKKCLNCYSQIKNIEYRFQVRVPKNWKKRVIDCGYKRIITLTRGRYTEITITAEKPDEQVIEKWEKWRDWYIRGIGRRLRRITETRKIIIEKEIVGKVLLFEYIYRGRSVLQKVLIANFRNALIVIECRAPLSSYKHYSNIFTVVMGSLKTYQP